MNLQVIKATLSNLIGSKSKEFYDSELQKLIRSIDTYLETENNLATTVHIILSTVSEYITIYETLIVEYRAIPTSLIKDRIDKSAEILSVLSSITTYLSTILGKYSLDESMPDLYKSLRDLTSKKGEYEGEKMTWRCVIKGLTQELATASDKMKYKYYLSRNEE